MMTITIPFILESMPQPRWLSPPLHGTTADAIRYRRSPRKRAKLRARRGKK